MTKQTIDVPEGYEAISEGTFKITPHGPFLTVALKKKPPRRRVFECVSEEPRVPVIGEWIEGENENSLLKCGHADIKSKYKIFKEVTE